MFSPIAIDHVQAGNEVVVCKDGIFRAAADVITHLAGAMQTRAAIETWGKAEIEADINSFILRKPGAVALVDVGLGEAWGPKFGHSRRQLRKLGIAPGDVDTIFLTHVHHDHVLGLFDGEVPYFPNATIYLSALEAEYLQDPAQRSSYGLLFAGIRRTYGNDRIKLINAGPVRPDIEAISLPGHSPGHIGYLLRGSTVDVLFCGDTFHLFDLQISDPDIGLIYDHSPLEAANSRRKTLNMATDNGWLLAGGHTPGLLQISKLAS